MIKWGMIGCGNVTEIKSGPAFNKVEGSRLVAVMRRDLMLAEDYARRHNVPRFYGDAEELINDNEVNAVYVATPPDSHARYALRSIKAGKPVYIEKPMALNYSECKKVISASEEYGVPVFVAYYRRTLPGFLKIKSMIENGEIGKVRFAKIDLFKNLTDDEKSGRLPWRVRPEISGGGHFFDLASHQLDYLDFIFGPLQKVRAIAINQAGAYPAEDFVSASFIYRNGIAATGNWCFSVSPEASRDSLEIFGEKGMIKTSTFSFQPIVIDNEKGHFEFINERPENIQFYLIEQIVKTLTGSGSVVSTARTAARTSRVMDIIVREYYKNKRTKLKTVME
jgi:predicted dehydrogenase